MKRFVSALLATAMLLCLCSCGGDRTPAVMTLGEHKVTEAMYSYWASSFKGTYIYSYEDVVNTDEYWATKIDGEQTVAEYFDALTLDAVKANLAVSKLFDEYRLSFTESEIAAIDGYISDLIAERAEGSKNMMNTMLGEYGINTKILKSIYLEEEKGAKVFEYLYGEGGEKALSDKELEEFYLDNYVRVQMIYIENINTYVTDENGNRVTDDSGYYMTEKLKGEAKEKQDAKVRAVKEGLEKGEDFDKLYEEYSELKAYKNGHYYSAAGAYTDVFYYRLVAEVEELEIGETCALESEMGTCIMKKLPLNEGAWKDKANESFFVEYEDTVSESEYRKLVESYFDDITVDEEIIKKYSVADVTPVYF